MPMISSVLSHQGNRKNKRYTARNNIPKFCHGFSWPSPLSFYPKKTLGKRIVHTHKHEWFIAPTIRDTHTYTQKKRKRKPLGLKRGKKKGETTTKRWAACFLYYYYFPLLLLGVHPFPTCWRFACGRVFCCCRRHHHHRRRLRERERREREKGWCCPEWFRCRP